MPNTKQVISNGNKLKIIVIVRTMNEEKYIEPFCSSYVWADKILVADGGSTDDTVKFASLYDFVEVREFPTIVEKNGHHFNPQGRHVNFLIDWAIEEEGADWIIFDDCDSLPNYALKQQGRLLIETAHYNNYEAVFLYRLYLWGLDKYFPLLNEPGQSIWAWRSDVDVRAREIGEEDGGMTIENIPERENRFYIEPPVCLLHYTWPDEEATKTKLEFYRAVHGEHIKHPLEFAGPLKELPDYANRFE